MKHAAANETISDMDTFEEELTENLMMVGYEEKTAIEMASTISFGICNSMPVVINENATTIGECLAATMGGKDLMQMFLSDPDVDIGAVYSILNTEDDNPPVFLLNGVLDSYNVSIYNALTSYLQADAINIVILISLEGIPANMISTSVWNKAVFVDGDEGLTGSLKQPVHAFGMDIIFEQTLDSNEYKIRRKEVDAFASLFSNLQLNIYAEYLATYGISLNESGAVLLQMITASRSAGTEGKLQSLFHEKGISNGEKMIARYL